MFTFRFKGLVRHIENVHLHTKKQDKKVLKFMKAIRCMCGQVFEEEKPALDHVMKFHLSDVENSLSSLEKSSKFPTNGEEYLKMELDEIKQEKASVQDIVKSIFIHMVLQCEFCDRIFSDSKSLVPHTSQHNPNEGFSCTQCDLRCLDFKSLHMHRRSECLNLKKSQKLMSLARSFICNICFNDFPTHEALIEHRYKEFHFYPRIDWDKDELHFLCEFW